MFTFRIVGLVSERKAILTQKEAVLHSLICLYKACRALYSIGGKDNIGNMNAMTLLKDILLGCFTVFSIGGGIYMTGRMARCLCQL